MQTPDIANPEATQGIQNTSPPEPLDQQQMMDIAEGFAMEMDVPFDFVKAIILAKLEYYYHGRVGTTNDGLNAGTYGPMEVHEGLLEGGIWADTAGVTGPDGELLSAEDIETNEELGIYAGIKHFSNLVLLYDGDPKQALNHYMTGNPSDSSHRPAAYLPEEYPEGEQSGSGADNDYSRTPTTSPDDAEQIAASNERSRQNNSLNGSSGVTSTQTNAPAQNATSGGNGNIDGNFGTVPRHHWGDGPAAQTIASVPGSTFWVNGSDAGSLESLKQYIAQCERDGTTPLVTLYNAPGKESGSWPPSGNDRGANGGADYMNYIQQVSDIIGDTNAVVTVEPDSFALGGGVADSERMAPIFDALEYMQANNANARLYLDVGHSEWLSEEQVISALTQDVNGRSLASLADGVSLNVSNHHTTESQAAYAKAIYDATGLTSIIDTSRNGNGYVNGHWDDYGAGLGVAPTTNTGYAWVDAYLWVKPPGEWDAPGKGGGFDEGYAQSLIDNSPYDW